MVRQVVPLPAEITVIPRSQWDRRRREPRYRCGPATLGHISAGKPIEMRRGWILDLSLLGAGLLVSQALERESLCIIYIKTTAGDRCYELLCRVMHATTQADGDWLIGCAFADPLTPEDLDALL